MVIKELAPTGDLRVAINYGNPVLAQKDPQSGEPKGVSVDLAKELARRLGVPVAFVVFDGAGKVFDALSKNLWDVAFLAIDPVRSAGITFTAPYVIIEGAYMVPMPSPLQNIDDVDKKGIRIAVGRGSAYDLFLTRTIKNAELVRAGTSADALEMFLHDKLEVAAGVRQPLLAFSEAHSGLRVLPGRFMSINQAVGTPNGRDAGAKYLRAFVEEMKSSGFVSNALASNGQTAATVAPLSKNDRE